MKKTVDIYMPLDERDAANAEIWPVASKQLGNIIQTIEKLGWKANVLNPDKPVSSVAEGMNIIRKAENERFINFIAGWAYPDFTVSPMCQIPRETPKLMLASILPDFPGAVGLLAAEAGNSHVGTETSRLFVEDFTDVEQYIEPLKSFLENGKYESDLPGTIDIPVNDENRKRARAVKDQLAGSIYGSVGPRSMEMWNKISDADFLSVFGMAREGFDGLRLLKMSEQVPDSKARAAMEFLIDNGMELKLGKDPSSELTEEMVLFQMKVYFALLELKRRYGLSVIGVQDQLDWIAYYPGTDLTLGLLNNKLRPEGDGSTFVAATEADDGAALTMQTLKLLNGGEPVGFNDLRYWKNGLYWFVNSGALAPYFAEGSNESLKGSWSERQPPMYFKQGGGTCSVVARKPGVVTWARFSYRNHEPYLCAGRGITDVADQKEWRERSASCDPQWPHWYLKLCGNIEQRINSNHPMTACGDYLADLKALAAELGIKFECYDHLPPEKL